MRPLSTRILVIFAFVFIAGFSTVVSAQTTTVTPNQPELWTNANDSGSGSTVISTNNPRGAGTGSLSFEGMDSSDDRAETRRVLGRSLTSIVEVGYDYWTDTENRSRQPSLKLEFFGARSGTLSWIPADNGGTLNTWNSVDATTGLWSSSENGSLQTLAEHQADLGAVLVNYIRVGTSAGSSLPLNEGYADLVTVTTTGELVGTQTWDFEATSTEPLPPPQTITVTTTEPELWASANNAGTSTSEITSNNPRGAGTGSIEFTMNETAEDRTEFRRIFGRSLLSIIGIGYDFWTDTDDGQRQPVLKIEYFGARSGTLLYYPSENSYTLGAWNSVDATNGLWRSSETGVVQTLAEHQAELGNILANYIRVGSVAGGTGTATTGYADLVWVSTPETGTRTWDFEDSPLPPLPPQEVITVTETDLAGWFAMDQAGSATVELTATQPHGPGNTGSLEFTTSGDASDIVHAARIPVVSVSDIREIGYDYYSNHAAQAPAMKLAYFSLSRGGTLVYDPIYQGAYPINAWNNADAAAGLWWSTESDQSDLRTLAEWQADIGDVLVTFLQVGVGSGWTNPVNGFVDSIYLATSASNTLWDFEDVVEVTPPDSGQFATSIKFSDGSTASVTSTIVCNAGLPLSQSFDISEATGVTFTVTELPVTQPGVNCEITVDDPLDSYTVVASANGGAPAASCIYVEGIPAEGESAFDETGQNTCVFVALAENPLYNVAAEWLDSGGDDPSSLSSEIDVEVACSTPILAVDGVPTGSPGYELSLTLMDGDLYELTVDGYSGDASCSATAQADVSAVDISGSEECDGADLAPAGSATCLFTVTLFFEGIPTLSQYGLALLALLMLGVGIVSMRRLA